MGSRSVFSGRTGTGTSLLTRAGQRLALIVLAATLCAATPAPAKDPPHESLDRFPTSTLAIDAGGPRHTFKVWMATTDERREQGLMYVRQLPADRGMLFVFDYPQILSFWMKNTRIPLDLLFVAADGRVIRIAENAEAESLTPISSMGGALAVLELAGGSAARLGLHPGARILHSSFRTPVSTTGSVPPHD